MPRWRQDKETGKLVPIDEAAAHRDGHFVQGDIEAFRSPIDGTVIADRKQLDEHCRKHNVVPAGEFSQEFYERKAKERANFYQGVTSTAETFKRRQDIHEIIERMIRNGR